MHSAKSAAGKWKGGARERITAAAPDRAFNAGVSDSRPLFSLDLKIQSPYTTYKIVTFIVAMIES
jgi:hypothetical protein